MPNVVKWFEIPVSNFKRAVKFFNYVFETELEETDVWGYFAALFQNEGDGVTGALVHSKDYRPTKKGTIVYFESSNRINAILDRIVTAGGKIVTPKTSLGDGLGYFALFEDTEGNTLGLHADF